MPRRVGSESALKTMLMVRYLANYRNDVNSELICGRRQRWSRRRRRPGGFAARVNAAPNARAVA